MLCHWITFLLCIFLNLVEPWKGIVLNAKLNFNKLNNFCLQETKKKNKSCFIWCYFADCDKNPLLKNRNIKLPKVRSTCLNSAEIFFFKCTTLSCFNTWTSLVIMALCAHLNVFLYLTKNSYSLNDSLRLLWLTTIIISFF